MSSAVQVHCSSLCHQMVWQDHFPPPTLSQELSWDNTLMCPHSGIICWSSWAHLPCDREMASQGIALQSKSRVPTTLSGPWIVRTIGYTVIVGALFQIDDSAPTHTIVWLYVFIPDLRLLHKAIHQVSCIPAIFKWTQQEVLSWCRGWYLETHSSILAWRIPGTEEPGGLPSTGSHRVRHDWCDLAAAAAAAEAGT